MLTIRGIIKRVSGVKLGDWSICELSTTFAELDDFERSSDSDASEISPLDAGFDPSFLALAAVMAIFFACSICVFAADIPAANSSSVMPTIVQHFERSQQNTSSCTSIGSDIILLDCENGLCNPD